MSRLILQMQTSIDGFVSSTRPDSPWLMWNWGSEWPWDRALRSSFNEVFEGAAGILLSPKMAREGYVDHWMRLGEQNSADPDWRFARRIGELPIYVPSRQGRQELVGLEIRVLVGGLGANVRTALADARGDVVCFGGAGLGRALLGADLVDELQLFVNPGVAHEGERIFSAVPCAQRFSPVGSAVFDCGIVVNRWHRLPADSATASHLGHRHAIESYLHRREPPLHQPQLHQHRDHLPGPPTQGSS
jgi:dihydrofolate reductase